MAVRPGFVGGDTTALRAGAVDLTDVGRELTAVGSHLRGIGRACASSCTSPLTGPLESFAAAVSARSVAVGEQVAAVGWLGRNLATDLDLATGGSP